MDGFKIPLGAFDTPAFGYVQVPISSASGGDVQRLGRPTTAQAFSRLRSTDFRHCSPSAVDGISNRRTAHFLVSTVSCDFVDFVAKQWRLRQWSAFVFEAGEGPIWWTVGSIDFVVWQ